jgi:hypothetical protein
MREFAFRAFRLASLALLTLGAEPATAAKWVTGCPKGGERFINAGRGAFTRAYFVHIGHELTYRLKDSAVLNEGGFSTEPDGNTVEITFMPVEGDPIPLPPFTVTAVSPTTLSFPFPDPTPLVGRLVVGPMQLVVRRGDTVVVHAKRPIVLPPMNDVQQLVSAGSEAEVLGAVDRSGRLWIPLTFGGYGPGEPMPECPAEMTPIVAFTTELSFRKGDGQFVPHASIANLRSTRLYLGDFVLFGENLYGRKISGALDVNHFGGANLTVCSLNDTLELVLMMRLRESAFNPQSEVLRIVRDGSPLTLKLRNASADAEIAPLLPQVTQDSFRNGCFSP